MAKNRIAVVGGGAAGLAAAVTAARLGADVTILDHMERVGKKLTPEEADAVWAAAMQVGTADTQECFVRGFRLGARLMLDVLAEDPAGQA